MQQFTLKLDPWATSSLLHKAIRRGEAELAQAAATSFYRYRGQAIWRRLLNIAFEDVGIADPDLVAEIAWLATNKRARSAIGDDSTIIQDFVAKLAACPKDRSTDYLICATLKLVVRNLTTASWTTKTITVSTMSDAPRVIGIIKPVT